MSDLLKRLSGVRKTGEGWTAQCPAHDDQQNSLSLHHREGKWLLKCHAGCAVESVTAAVGLSLADLFDDTGQRGAGGVYPSSNRATAQPKAQHRQTPVKLQPATAEPPRRPARPQGPAAPHTRRRCAAPLPSALT